LKIMWENRIQVVVIEIIHQNYYITGTFFISVCNHIKSLKFEKQRSLL